MEDVTHFGKKQPALRVIAKWRLGSCFQPSGPISETIYGHHNPLLQHFRPYAERTGLVFAMVAKRHTALSEPKGDLANES